LYCTGATPPVAVAVKVRGVKTGCGLVLSGVRPVTLRVAASALPTATTSDSHSSEHTTMAGSRVVLDPWDECEHCGIRPLSLLFISRVVSQYDV
jgi:hypothetical protein